MASLSIQMWCCGLIIENTKFEAGHGLCSEQHVIMFFSQVANILLDYWNEFKREVYLNQQYSLLSKVPLDWNGSADWVDNEAKREMGKYNSYVVSVLVSSGVKEILKRKWQTTWLYEKRYRIAFHIHLLRRRQAVSRLARKRCILKIIILWPSLNMTQSDKTIFQAWLSESIIAQLLLKRRNALVGGLQMSNRAHWSGNRGICTTLGWATGM